MKVAIAVADKMNSVGELFTEEALRKIASEDLRCSFDELTKSLWMEIDEKELSSQIAKRGGNFSIGWKDDGSK